MAPNRVLKLNRTDDDSRYVLLHVTPRGSKPLDLSMVCTDGEGRYVATLRQSKVSSLRMKNSPASEAEWENILDSLFMQELLPDIQASATVQDGTSVSVTVRKQIQGITQRLGSISLDYDMDGEIQLLDWCATATDAAMQAKEAAATASANTQKLETEVTDLKSQLEELILAKNQDETALLQKFRDLLNEKKVKIREQQKVIATGSFTDGERAPSPASHQQASPPKRKAGQSRSSKRKSPPETRRDNDDEMDLDPVKSEPEETEDGNTTEATASVDSDVEDEPSAQDDSTRDEGRRQPSKKIVEQPPAPRSLPFANKKPGNAASKTTAARAQSDTESDDEL